LKQLGYPFTTAIEYGMAVRAGTPENIRRKLEDTLRKTVELPEVKKTMEGMGMPARFLDGKKFKEIVSEEVKSIPVLIKYNKALEGG
jgi:tripartite-type tricarboxylate transporter receptor subunit TctC